MATLNIAPFASAGITENSDLPILRNMLATQAVTISGTSAQSTALPATTRYVDITTDTNCYVALGSNPTASSTNGLVVWANTYRQVGIPDGVSAGSCKVAAVTF